LERKWRGEGEIINKRVVEEDLIKKEERYFFIEIYFHRKWW